MKKPIKISLIILHNTEEIKLFKIHDNCHIPFKDRTLDIIDCRIQKAKYLITCTAVLNREKEVDFYWGVISTSFNKYSFVKNKG